MASINHGPSMLQETHVHNSHKSGMGSARRRSQRPEVKRTDILTGKSRRDMIADLRRGIPFIPCCYTDKIVARISRHVRIPLGYHYDEKGYAVIDVL